VGEIVIRLIGMLVKLELFQLKLYWLNELCYVEPLAGKSHAIFLIKYDLQGG
jgi:hypothetical protein